MKTRSGFVSNSSSASFVINKQYLDDEQIKQLLDYEGDHWEITESDSSVKGYTFMDNGYLRKFMKSIDVPMNKMKWTEG